MSSVFAQFLSALRRAGLPAAAHGGAKAALRRAVFRSASDLDTAVKRVVLLVLKSPRFLYREIDGGRDAYDVASRLSFGLWDSLPDPELLEAAAKGRPGHTCRRKARQAERMLPDLRTRAKLREFLLQWLKVDHVPDLAKDPKRFPGIRSVRSPPTCALRSTCSWKTWSGARRRISASSCWRTSCT